MESFSLGDTVIFEPKNLNQDYWIKLNEESRIVFYGDYGYGGKLKLFTFITYHYPQYDHCVLMDMDTGKLLPMCHFSNFRLVSDEEC